MPMQQSSIILSKHCLTHAVERWVCSFLSFQIAQRIWAMHSWIIRTTELRVSDYYNRSYFWRWPGYSEWLKYAYALIYLEQWHILNQIVHISYIWRRWGFCNLLERGIIYIMLLHICTVYYLFNCNPRNQRECHSAIFACFVNMWYYE